MKTPLCILAALTLLCGCQKNPFPETEEAPEQKLERWRALAKDSMLSEATNRVPGISRIIFCDVENSWAGAVKWQGHVTVDFVNQAGGIDRTNLYYRYFFSEHGVSAERDAGREYQMDLYAITNH